VAKPIASNVEAEKVVEVTPLSPIPNIVAGKIVIEEDPLLVDILRSKDMATTSYVGDIFTKVIEISHIVVSAIPVQLRQVEDNLAQAEKQVEDHQNNKFPDMHISGPRSDAVTDLDYIEEDHINSNVDHDLVVFLQSFWKTKMTVLVCLGFILTGKRESERERQQLFKNTFCCCGRAFH
jgi:hypothetical protein